MLNSQKIVIGCKLFAPPDVLDVNNFLDPAIPCFKARRRSKTPVTELVLHETVTTSVKTTIAVLQRRKLGVHFIVGPYGAITQHNDLALDRVAHAPPHNKRSVGIEIVTPYYATLLGEGQPWKQVIDAKWAHKKRYVVPTLEQAEAMGRLLTGRLPRPGIYAHTAFGHADGAWPELYSWLRIEAGLEPAVAYAEAIERATGSIRLVELGDFIAKEE